MSLKSEKLPTNWIRKESRSSPNKFYYLNTKTKKSQWNMPHNDEKIVEKESEYYEKKEIESNRFKIDNKSKNVSKKLKTPAQDRLEKVKISLKAPKAASVDKKSEYVPNKKKIARDEVDSCSRQDIPEPKRRMLVTPTKKKLNAAIVTSIIDHIEKESESNVDIPTIFGSKTPAQKRLMKLRKQLEAQNNSEMLNDEKGIYFDDSLYVIQNGFGIKTQSGLTNGGSANISGIQNDNDDMEMDWEPSFTEDTNLTDVSIKDIVFEDLSESAYIVPDTNVFLDSLICIQNIMQKDKKYCVLVPFAVLQELDGLKQRNGNDSIKDLASTAIRFIYNQLKSKSQHLQGQKATDDQKHIINVKGADDKILNCCLQLQGKGKEVILVTNDINLSNKALTSGIEAITSQECMKKYNL